MVKLTKPSFSEILLIKSLNLRSNPILISFLFGPNFSVLHSCKLKDMTNTILFQTDLFLASLAEIKNWRKEVMLSHICTELFTSKSASTFRQFCFFNGIDEIILSESVSKNSKDKNQRDLNLFSIQSGLSLNLINTFDVYITPLQQNV